MDEYKIPFNRPFVAGKELYHIAQSVLDGQTSGDGPYGKRCEEFLRRIIDTPYALLSTSSSAAIHMATMACGIGAGDEVIMPTFTASGGANAALNRGAKVVFCDISEDTLTLDTKLGRGSNHEPNAGNYPSPLRRCFPGYGCPNEHGSQARSVDH